MPNKRLRGHKKNTTKSTAAWKLTTLFIVFGGMVFGILWWARTDADSDAAKKIRELTGIVLVTQPTPKPEPVKVIEPEPEPVEIVVAPEPPEPPDPQKPTKLDWSTFRSQPEMWPNFLRIMVDKEVALTYRGKSFGEVKFTEGQLLKVKGFSENGFVVGQTEGSEMEVHLSATNFIKWFEEEHGDQHFMDYPENQSIEPSAGYEDALITELRIWSMQNYNTPLIEIGENNLVLRIQKDSERGNHANYAPEAMSVARAYLRIQADLGGTDNYASCEIRDTATGELLGANGIFVSRF